MDQIFSLRNIIEQSTEWNAPLCIGFIDFKKAFGSIHHKTLWKILRHYGLPQKIISLINDFSYLGSKISAENSVQKVISARINKARNSYCSIRNIWKSNIYSLKTKLRFFNSNVISVLLYGCQSWRVSKDDMNKLDVFQTKCLRRTCNIFWPNKISNEDLYRITNLSPISTQIQKHRLRWLGHVLRMPQDYIPKVALRWTPTGKRNRGRPKTRWRRTITT